MANKGIDFWKASKTKGFFLKLDIEKSFDKLNWNFIDYMLLVKNYSSIWRNWIKACISNVNYSILINGKPHGKIHEKRGLRQRDPISPFLFVIAMNYFSKLLKHLEVCESIRGVSFNSNCNLFHILFTDDILLFIEENDVFFKNLHMAITLFKKALELNIKLVKSIICPIM